MSPKTPTRSGLGGLIAVGEATAGGTSDVPQAAPNRTTAPSPMLRNASRLPSTAAAFCTLAVRRDYGSSGSSTAQRDQQAQVRASSGSKSRSQAQVHTGARTRHYRYERP